MPRLSVFGLIPGQSDGPDPLKVYNHLARVMRDMGLGEEAAIWLAHGPVMSCHEQPHHQPFVQIQSTGGKCSTPAQEEDRIADNPDFRTVCIHFKLEIEVGAGPRRFIPLDELDKLPEPIDERGSS